MEKRLLQLLFIASCFLIPFTYLYLQSLNIFTLGEHNLKALTEWKPQSETLVYDSKENILGSLYHRHQVYYSFDDMPRKIVEAIIAIEDKNFWNHQGVDFLAIVRTSLKNLRYPDRKRGGASTLTQQLVKNFVSTKERTYLRKIREVVLAYRLEGVMSKEKILEIYLNALFLGNGAYGIGSAAIRYFGRDLLDLETHELALLAGLFQAPSLLNPFRNPELAKKRQIAVLKAMGRNGFLTKEEFYTEVRKELLYVPYEGKKRAPYFLDYVSKEASQILSEVSVKNKGLHIYTSLDPELQKSAEESFQEQEESFSKLESELSHEQVLSGGIKGEKSPRLEAALLSNDKDSGAILAMVGGRDYGQSQFNRTYQAYRQPGSAFKPIVYSFALKQGYKWSDVRFVAPVNLPGDYKPRSYEGDYLSETTLLRALYRSINSVSLDLGRDLGLKDLLNYAKEIGIETKLKDEFGTLIGSSEVSLVDMAQVYSLFGNGGYQKSLYGIERIENSEGEILYDRALTRGESQQILSDEESYLITKGLEMVLRFGTARSQKKLASFAAGKTGTSNGARDNWFCGYTEKATTIVWVGSDNFEALGEEASGANLALPLWSSYVRKELEYMGYEKRQDHPNLMKLQVDPKHGFLSNEGISMWFKKDNIPVKTRSSLDLLMQKRLYRSY